MQGYEKKSAIFEYGEIMVTIMMIYNLILIESVHFDFVLNLAEYGQDNMYYEKVMTLLSRILNN